MNISRLIKYSVFMVGFVAGVANALSITVSNQSGNAISVVFDPHFRLPGATLIAPADSSTVTPTILKMSSLGIKSNILYSISDSSGNVLPIRCPPITLMSSTTSVTVTVTDMDCTTTIP